MYCKRILFWFFVFNSKGNLKVTIHKHVVLRLVNHGKCNQTLSIASIQLVRLDDWIVYCVDHLHTDIPEFLRFFTIFQKKSLKFLPLHFHQILYYCYLTKVIVSLDLTLSERKGLPVFQNVLLSVVSFSFNFAKYYFFFFLRRETQKFLFLLQINSFWSVGFFKNLFLKRVLCKTFQS